MLNLLILITLIFSQTMRADEEEDLFADFEDIPIEIDKTYEDDFLDIEKSSAGSNTAKIDRYDNFAPFAARDLLRRETSISVLGASETINSQYHLTIFPQGHFQIWRIRGHLGMPLRFPVYDTGGVNRLGMRRAGLFKGREFIVPRKQDFRSFFDVQKIVREFQIGESHEPYYFSLSRSYAVTLGQGELLRNISPEGLYDEDTLFLHGHAGWSMFTIDGFLAPIMRAEMVGVSTKLSPLATLDINPLFKDLSLELTYINDFFAPNDPHKKSGAYILNDERRRVKRERGTAQGLVTAVVYDMEPLNWLSLKPYLSYGHLWLTNVMTTRNMRGTTYGAGLHLGHELSFNFLKEPKRSALVLRAEGRLFSKNYVPGYFGSTYLIDRLNVDENTSLTKSQLTAAGGDGRFRVGYLFELGYVYDDMISTMIGYENAHSFAHGTSIKPLRKLHFVTSFLGLDVVKLHVGYEVTSIERMKEIFDFKKSRALLSLRTQFKLMPFLYFDAWLKHAFGINDMIASEDNEAKPVWLSSLPETRSLNFGLGLEFAMTF